MASIDPPLERGPGSGLLEPYPVLLAGVGVTFVALMVQGVTRGAQSGAAVGLTLAGLVIAGAGVASGLRRWREGMPAVGLWVLLAVACALGHFAVGPAWDSFALLLTVGTVVSGTVAALTAMPTRWRRFFITLAILGHFTAIATAVVMVPPTGGQPPWLAQQLWTRWSRPYLLFTNLNNGYHFYAPDPGPTALLWFQVRFADGATRWVRFPDHDACVSHIDRRRWAALATSVSQTVPAQPDQFEKLATNRGKREDIPLAPNMAPAAQYREPTLPAKMLLASYARYVAQTTEHPLGEGHAVTAVKVYRVDYHNPSAEHFYAGRPGLEPTLYHAFYQGEFDANGQLTPQSMKLTYNARGELTHREQDPLLYWLIPIVRVREGAAPPKQPRSEPSEEGRVINYVRFHAGEPGEESIP